MGKRTFKYAGAFYLKFSPNYVKSGSSLNNFENIMIKYFNSVISFISYFLAHTYYIDLARRLL